MVAAPSLDTFIIKVCFEEHPAMSRKLTTKRDPKITREIADNSFFFMCFDLRLDLTENF
jgi:hypothetical protein